jgi:hypothetical protein
VQVDALAIRLRPRTPLEAADFGVRLCQKAGASVARCYLVSALPVVALAAASAELGSWLPGIVIWWLKPWLDQSILFALSRAAFGQATTAGDLWRARRQVWWRQLPFTLTIRRLSPWRSLTQPVYGLEGLSIRQASGRVRQIRKRAAGQALLVTHAFSMSETLLTFALMSLVIWLAPTGLAPTFDEIFGGGSGQRNIVALVVNCSYPVAALFLEPFYVGAGFAMYLNRRVELEAWDVEQELRRAFAE